MSDINRPNEITFAYNFRLKDGSEKNFTVRIDNSTLNLIHEGEKEYPEWTELEKFRCPHCPLDSKDYKYCPLAINLVDVLNVFSSSYSHENIELRIETEAREYLKNTSLQAGVSSLLGILMVTSGCPIMGKLQPMVRFHLPFATLDETEYRVLSMYLLAQFFLKKNGREPDWNMENLVQVYDDIRILNQNVVKKIADQEAKDATINAVVILNNFADYVTINLDEKTLDELELLFTDYLRP
jgi:Domain of unknown function (DUF6901)